VSAPLRLSVRPEGLPEEIVSSSLAFGGGIHAAIELWFNARMAGEPEPDHDALLAAFLGGVARQGRAGDDQVRQARQR
jgi:hypothetical protein